MFQDINERKKDAARQVVIELKNTSGDNDSLYAALIKLCEIVTYQRALIEQLQSEVDDLASEADRMKRDEIMERIEALKQKRHRLDVQITEIDNEIEALRDALEAIDDDPITDWLGEHLQEATQ